FGLNFVGFPNLYYEMQTTETTRGQWKKVIGTYPEESLTPQDLQECLEGNTMIRDDFHPVTCVSWKEANAFARRLTDRGDGYAYRLPSGAEWHAFANNSRTSMEGWCSVDSTQRVATLTPYFGVYDIIGNVAEWTSDIEETFAANRAPSHVAYNL